MLKRKIVKDVTDHAVAVLIVLTTARAVQQAVLLVAVQNSIGIAVQSYTVLKLCMIVPLLIGGRS